MSETYRVTKDFKLALLNGAFRNEEDGPYSLVIKAVEREKRRVGDTIRITISVVNRNGMVICESPRAYPLDVGGSVTLENFTALMNITLSE